MNNLSTMTDDTRRLTAPEQAITDMIGEQFVEWMFEAAQQTVRSWPEIGQLHHANPKIEKIRKFLLQRFLAEETMFGREGDPGFLGFAIANLSEASDPLAENALEMLEKVREKNADPEKSRHKLWIRLLKSSGITQEEMNRAEPKEPARNYVAELSDLYSNSDWQTAIAAFESQLRCASLEYEAIKSLLKNNTDMSDEEAGVLSSREKDTDGLEASLAKIAVDEEGKRQLWDGVVRQLNIRRDFYAGLVKHLVMP